jgi:hypothetical protein
MAGPTLYCGQGERDHLDVRGVVRRETITDAGLLASPVRNRDDPDAGAEDKVIQSWARRRDAVKGKLTPSSAQAVSPACAIRRVGDGPALPEAITGRRPRGW